MSNFEQESRTGILHRLSNLLIAYNLQWRSLTNSGCSHTSIIDGPPWTTANSVRKPRLGRALVWRTIMNSHGNRFQRDGAGSLSNVSYSEVCASNHRSNMWSFRSPTSNSN